MHQGNKIKLPGSIGFPGSSAGKESACNAGDPSSIPGSGRSPRKRIGYPLQFSWASLVAEMTKNPPAMWATWVLSLGREDPPEKGMATHSSILAWKIHDRGAQWSTVHWVYTAQSQTQGHYQLFSKQELLATSLQFQISSHHCNFVIISDSQSFLA